jgi:hypothetical protein
VGESSPKADGADSGAAPVTNGSPEATGSAADAEPRRQDGEDLVLVNFGDTYDAQAAERHGDLGPAVAGNLGGRDRGGRDRGPRTRRPRRR